MPNPLTGQPSFIRHTETMNMEDQIRALGYKVISIWGHTFNELLKVNPDVKAFIDSLDFTDRLEPRYILKYIQLA